MPYLIDFEMTIAWPPGKYANVWPVILIPKQYWKNVQIEGFFFNKSFRTLEIFVIGPFSGLDMTEQSLAEQALVYWYIVQQFA